MKVILCNATNIDAIIGRGYVGDVLWDAFVPSSDITLFITKTSELMAWVRDEYIRVSKVTTETPLTEIFAITDILKEISAVLFNLAKVKTEHVYLTNRI